MNAQKPLKKRSSSTPRSTSSASNGDVVKSTSAASSKSKKKALEVVTSPRSVASKVPSSKAVSPRSTAKPSSPSDHVRFSRENAEMVGVFKYTCEEVIYDELIALKSIILKSNASRTFHDFSMLQGHVQNRAVSAVEEELTQLSEKLLALRGPSPNHRVTVFAQLFASLTNEIEAAVFNVDRRSVYGLKNDHLAAKAVHDQQQTAYLEKLAKKDQTIQALQAEQTSLDFKNKSLVRTVELLSKELEKCNASLSNVHQRSVELRIQGIDFKAEVDKRAERILQSIQARVGFVPGTIQKHVTQLTQLLPPGDVNYDKARMEIYKRYPEGHGSSAPGTPTSTTRKAAQQMQTQTLAALTTNSPRSSFTSSSCPSTANMSQAQMQGHGQGHVQGHGLSRSPPPTPPRTQQMANSNTNTSFISTSSYSIEKDSNGASQVATTTERSAAQSSINQAQHTVQTSSFIHTSSHTNAPAKSSTKAFTNSLVINTNTISANLQDSAIEPVRSSLSPSSRAQMEQKRQVLITSLFPRSVTLQDTTGIAGISFPTSSEEPNRQDSHTTPPLQDVDIGGLSITGQAVTLRAAQTEADRRYLAELLDTDEMEEEGSEPDDAGSSPSPDNERNVLNDEEDSEGSDENEDSDYEDTEFDGAETRTNPNASLPSRHSFTDATSDSSDSSDSSSDSDSDSSGDMGVSSTSPGADDELPPARKSSTVAAEVLHAPYTQYSQHTLPSTSQHASHGELYSESDEGSDFHRNMEKFIKDYRAQQHANNSFKIDISDSEIEPQGRKVAAGIAAGGKRQENKTKNVKNATAKKTSTLGVSNVKRIQASKLPSKRA